MKKSLIILLFFGALSVCVNVFWFYTNDAFYPKHMQPPVEVSCDKHSTFFPEGSYTYLGHGKQSIAFESADKGHVLKLFYWKRPIRKHWYQSFETWLRYASPLWIFKTLNKKNEIKKLFTRYIWGFTDLPEETALIHVHFSNTKEPIPVTVHERNGIAHELNLANFPFVIQKKITLLPDYLDSKLRLGDVEGAKKAIDLLRAYFDKRIAMGYVDNPTVFVKNYGFFDDKVVQIDIGKFKKPAVYDVQKEQEKVLNNLDKMVRKKYPILQSITPP